MLKKFLIASVCVLCATAWQSSAQDSSNDVFIPISKYLRQGDAECLSAWFDDTIEISMLSDSGVSSKSQARQIVKSFFSLYPPRSFEITHTASQGDLKYAVGKLVAGSESFEVTIFINYRRNGYKVQLLKLVRQ